MRNGKWLAMAAFAAMLSTTGPAWAGDLKLGSSPLETDDSGKLTKAGAAAATNEIEAQPGNEVWVVHMWAKIDRPAEGPLYVEFYRDRDGKLLVAHRHEIPDYEGDKLMSLEIEIGREEGFRPGEKLEVAFVQNVGGKDVKQAKAKLTLLASTAPPPTAPASDDDEGDDDEDDGEDEDGDEGEGQNDDDVPPAAAPAGPPPVESGDKKGCRIADPAGASPLALLLLVGVQRRRRRHNSVCG